MTKGNFFRYYNRLTGADRTLVFFIYNSKVYKYDCKHIAPRWTRKERESAKNGGWEKFKMYINADEKKRLVPKSEVVMTIEEFEAIPYKNKGHKCEYWLHKAYNLGEYKTDNIRFDKCGDVRINGIEYQVKFENASLTNVNILHKAQKDARIAKKAVAC